MDFGQNLTGWVEFDCRISAGKGIRLTASEIMQDQEFYHENLRTAKTEFLYLSDGKEAHVRPHFTFYGFRYMKAEVVQEVRNGEDVTLRCEESLSDEEWKTQFQAVHLRSDFDQIGWIETGDQKVNQLFSNALWGQKGNFLDVPTDCPQRDERLGWTGDAQVFAPTASYHMDTRAFFHKFVKDLRDEQKMIDGAVPNYVPNIGHKEDAGSVWGDIATFLPYTLYIYFGNQEEMNYCYPLMKDWVDYIDRKDGERGEKHYLFDFGFHFGDWLALDGATPTSFKGSTEDTYIASVYYCESVRKTAEIAETLGLTEDAAHYRKLEEKIRQAVLAE